MIIQVPPGFDYAQLISDFYAVAEPFVGIAFMFGTGVLIINFLRSLS